MRQTEYCRKADVRVQRSHENANWASQGLCDPKWFDEESVEAREGLFVLGSKDPGVCNQKCYDISRPETFGTREFVGWRGWGIRTLFLYHGSEPRCFRKVRFGRVYEWRARAAVEPGLQRLGLLSARPSRLWDLKTLYHMAATKRHGGPFTAKRGILFRSWDLVNGTREDNSNNDSFLSSTDDFGVLKEIRESILYRFQVPFSNSTFLGSVLFTLRCCQPLGLGVILSLQFVFACWP